MKIKEIYQNLKEKLKNYFWEEDLTENQREYLFSGMNPEILEKFKIIYNPDKIRFIYSDSGTAFKGLEKKVESLDNSPLNISNVEDNKGSSEYLDSLRREIRENHKKNMETIRNNHLMKMGEIYSNFVGKISETVKGKIGNIKEYVLETFSDGKVRLSFVR
ncbi:MAG: hypothetical protein NUV46_00300 [Nanoarchaeota archaeon]|nr:hypothetical protein [Nanoarchaeota archaeon]